MRACNPNYESLKPHFLKSTKNRLSLNCFISFDVESNLIDYENIENKTNIIIQKQEFRLVCAIFYDLINEIEIKKHFFSTKEFYKWVIELNEKMEYSTIYLFAHNLDYDIRLSNTFVELTNLKYNLTNYYNDSIMFLEFTKKSQTHFKLYLNTKKKYNFRRKEYKTYQTTSKKFRNNKLVFLDTCNYFSPPPSLRELGKWLSIHKLFIDFRTATEKALIQYCYRDCEIVKKFVINLKQFCVNHNVEFSYTASSMAWKTFKNHFLKPKQIYIHNRSHQLKIEKNSYRGGLTIPFYVGEITKNEYPIYAIDYNSLYPYIMANKKLPTKLLIYRNYTHCNQNEMRKLLFDKFYHIALVKIVISDYEIRKKFIQITNSNNKNVIAIGECVIYLSQPEIEYYKDYISFIYEVSTYASEIIFDEYVNYFYSIKKNPKDKSERNFSKMLMNSLSGKFAQMAMEIKKVNQKEIDSNSSLIYLCEKYREYSFVKLPSVIINGKRIRYFKFMNTLYKIQKSEIYPTFDAFIPISSGITAYGRIELLKSRDIAKANNVFYCDSDSLYVNQLGFDRLKNKNLIHKTELGKLKVEHIIINMKIFGPKSYEFTEIFTETNKIKNYSRKIKGLKKDAVLISESNDNLTFNQTEWIRLKKASIEPETLNIQFVKSQTKIIQKTTDKDYKKEKQFYITIY